MRKRSDELLRGADLFLGKLRIAAIAKHRAMIERVVANPMAFGVWAFGERPGSRQADLLTGDEEARFETSLQQQVQDCRGRALRIGAIVEGQRDLPSNCIRC